MCRWKTRALRRALTGRRDEIGFRQGEKCREGRTLRYRYTIRDLGEGEAGAAGVGPEQIKELERSSDRPDVITRVISRIAGGGWTGMW